MAALFSWLQAKGPFGTLHPGRLRPATSRKTLLNREFTFHGALLGERAGCSWWLGKTLSTNKTALKARTDSTSRTGSNHGNGSRAIDERSWNAEGSAKAWFRVSSGTEATRRWFERSVHVTWARTRCCIGSVTPTSATRVQARWWYRRERSGR